MRTCLPMGCRCLALAAVAAIAVAAPAPGRAAGLPPRNQALLLLRVLAYDRNLKQRAGPAVTVAVVYRAGDAASEERSGALVSAFEDVAGAVVVGGLPVKVEAIPYRGPADLDARLGAAHPTLACIDPALASAVPDISALSRRLSILTASGSRALAEAGLAVAVMPQGERAAILVNLKASRQEGVDFDAALLALSEVLRS